jgi:hypothetical protein
MRIKSLPAFLPSRLRIRLALILSLGLAGLCLVPPAGAEYGDVVLNRISEANDMRPVIFPHWFHRMRFRCKVCHGELGFEMRAGSNPMDMGHLCHSGKPGLKTGIRGSNQTGGPGRW